MGPRCLLAMPSVKKPLGWSSRPVDDQQSDYADHDIVQRLGVAMCDCLGQSTQNGKHDKIDMGAVHHRIAIFLAMPQLRHPLARVECVGMLQYASEPHVLNVLTMSNVNMRGACHAFIVKDDVIDGLVESNSLVANHNRHHNALM